MENEKYILMVNKWGEYYQRGYPRKEIVTTGNPLDACIFEDEVEARISSDFLKSYGIKVEIYKLVSTYNLIKIE